MTIAREIERTVRRLEGAAVCDLCLTDQLNLSVPSQVNNVVRGLAGSRGFERERAACGACGKTKIVTLHRAG